MQAKGLWETSAAAPGYRRWQKSEAATANAGSVTESAGFGCGRGDGGASCRANRGQEAVKTCDWQTEAPARRAQALEHQRGTDASVCHPDSVGSFSQLPNERISYKLRRKFMSHPNTKCVSHGVPLSKPAPPFELPELLCRAKIVTETRALSCLSALASAPVGFYVARIRPLFELVGGRLRARRWGASCRARCGGTGRRHRLPHDI